MSALNEAFRRAAGAVAYACGTPWAFLLAVGTVVVWAATGPHFGWSDTHQLVINTSTTIITYLMVFLIQATQNRDTRALHLKLDEILRALADARTELARAEEMSEPEVEREIEEIKREGAP